MTVWWEDFVQGSVQVGVGEHSISVGCYGEKSKRGEACSLQKEPFELKPSANTNWKKQNCKNN